MRSIADIQKTLSGGVQDEFLSRLYCRTETELRPYRERVLRLVRDYQAAFDKDDTAKVSVFSAPGRTELGGNHTDHQRGKVLTGSVDLDALACAAPNGTDVIRLFSENYGLVTMHCKEPDPIEEEKNTTKALLRGVAAKITALGFPVGGFDAYVISDVPSGSGLSSSACFEVLIGTVVNHLFCGGKLAPAEIAKIGQYAENVYFGKPSGLLDQMGCALGGVAEIDFRQKGQPEVRTMSLDLAGAGYALCIVDTGADHADLTEDYAAIPGEMERIASAFGREVLCEVDEDEFYPAVPALRRQHGDRAVLRAIHYYSECRRVEEQAEALERQDFQEFLRLVDASGRSSYMYLQNVSTFREPGEQPVAVALAMAERCLRGRGACRVHGGGFAGTIQAFVPLDDVPSFRTNMDGLLGEGACRVTYIRPVGCCTLID